MCCRSSIRPRSSRRRAWTLVLASLWGVGLALAPGPAIAAPRGDLLVVIGGLPSGTKVTVKLKSVAGSYKHTFRRTGEFDVTSLPIGRYKAFAPKVTFRKTTKAGAVKGAVATAKSICAPARCNSLNTVKVISSGTRVLFVRYTSGKAPGPARFTQFAGVVGNLCGARSDGIVRCWGNPLSSYPPSAGALTQITGDGVDGLCGLRPDGSPECARGLPAPAGLKLTSIAVSNGLVCGTRQVDGIIACWAKGRLGLLATPPAGAYKAVALTGDSTQRNVCGLASDGSLACEDGSNALPPGSLKSVVGGRALVGLRPDGTMWTGTPSAASVLPGNFSELTPGGDCGLRVDGAIVCQPPSAGAAPTLTPGPFTAVVSDNDAPSVCGMLAGGALKCFLKNPADTSAASQPATWQAVPAN